MNKQIKRLALASLLAAAGSAALAGNYTQVPDPATVAPGATVNVAIQFAGDGVTQETQLDLNYNSTVFTTVVPTTVVAGSVCAVSPAPPFIRIAPPSGAGMPLTGTATTYCSFAFTAAPGAAAGNYDFTVRDILCDGPTCTNTGPFRITVGAVATNTLSVVSGSGQSATVSTAFALPLVARVAGAGDAPVAGVTVTFTAPGAGASAVLSAPSCVTAANGNCSVNATANATAGAYNVVAASAGLTSVNFALTNTPVVVGATPPVLTYNPQSGTGVNVAAGSATTIVVGCQADGANCEGSGVGLDATTRLEGLNAIYQGNSPSGLAMVCNFVNQAGTVLAGPNLDFVAQTADPGNIRCTCPQNTTNLPVEVYSVIVNERRPASGATTVQRGFTINCGGPTPVCPTPTYVNASPNATVPLANGGAASVVTNVSLVGASNGVNQTIVCSTSNVSAGSAFTVTTNPSPLVVSTTPALGGSVSASCTNSASTVGTATLTCVGTSATPGCASTTTFTLSCPGTGGPMPPTGEFVPVPSLNEQGRILLAALVLLLGLGVVGFRMRG